MLVGCLLLNKTSRKQADRVWPELFERWPDPESLASAGDELEELLRPLGFCSTKAKRLREMSARYAAGDWNDPSELPGVGKYARDSWAMFVDGDPWSVEPEDEKLRANLERVRRSTRRSDVVDQLRSF